MLHEKTVPSVIGGTVFYFCCAKQSFCFQKDRHFTIY